MKISMRARIIVIAAAALIVTIICIGQASKSPSFAEQLAEEAREANMAKDLAEAEWGDWLWFEDSPPQPIIHHGGDGCSMAINLARGQGNYREIRDLAKKVIKITKHGTAEADSLAIAFCTPPFG